MTKQSILEDKYYIGFYQEEKLIAVMDFILQNKGLGTEIINYLCKYLAQLGYSSIRLAWVKGNPQTEHFWLKNHFTPVKQTRSNVTEEVILAERCLNC